MILSKKLLYLSSLLPLLLGTGPAVAADAAAASGGRLTLDAAIAEALARSPVVRAIEADVEAARGELLTTQLKPNTELTVSPALKRQREPENTRHEFVGSIGVTKTLVFPGRREVLISLAERNVALRQLGIEGLQFQLTAAVREAYYELFAAQSIVGLRQQQLEAAQTFQQGTARRVTEGFGSDFEAVKSLGDVINAQKLLRAAEGDIVSARVELNALLGRDPSVPLEAIGVLDETAPTRAVADLVTLALARNPSLRVQALRTEIADLNVRRARLARKSDIFVGPSLEFSRTEQVLGISATVSLPAKGYGQGEIMTANAEQRKIAAETDQLRREISGAVAMAAARLDAARSQLALYTPAYLGQLKAAAEQAEQSYAQNATALLIYLDAKRTYFDTLAEHNEAISNVAQARAALESAIGAPLQPTSAELNR